MKKWLQNNFLPMWAKQTLLRDNRILQEENRCLQQKINEMEAYIAGMQMGTKALKRISIVNRGGQA